MNKNLKIVWKLVIIILAVYGMFRVLLDQFIVIPKLTDAVYLVAPTAFDTDSNWKPLMSNILTTEARNIHIVWSGYGGDSLIQAQLVNVILQAQKQGKIIIIHSNSVAYSAHAMTLCYADKVETSPGFFAVFHAMRRNGVIVTDTAFRGLLDEQLSKCVATGWLTEEEAFAIKEGKKVTVSHNRQSAIEEDL